MFCHSEKYNHAKKGSSCEHTGKNGFAKVSKNVARYTDENNYD